MAFKTNHEDIKQFVLKLTDIGYDAEAGAELSPNIRGAYGQTPRQRASSTTSTRPPIMLHPGE